MRAHHLSYRLNLPEILAHIESLSEGEFIWHEASKKWGYRIATVGGASHSEFVNFSIRSEIGEHLTISLYGKPGEFEASSLLPLVKGRGNSYSECKFEKGSQKNALINYLTASFKLWYKGIRKDGWDVLI